MELEVLPTRKVLSGNKFPALNQELLGYYSYNLKSGSPISTIHLIP
jgi:hypothetical protein